MIILNGTTLMMAGLAVLTTATVAVASVTLYKNYQQGKKLEEVKSDIATIETDNKQTVGGLIDKFNVQLEEQKKANKKNNPELIAAKKDVDEAKAALDNAKVVFKVIKKDWPVLLDTARVVNAGNMQVDTGKFPFLAGAAAPAVGAAKSVTDAKDLWNKISEAMKTYTKPALVAETGQNIAGRLVDGGAAQLAEDAKAVLKGNAYMEAQHRLETAEQNLKDAEARLLAVNAALN